MGAAGHVEAGESVLAAGVREAWEEVDVLISEADLVPLCAMHRTEGTGRPVDERVDFFFTCSRWSGEPRRLEEHKSADLRWFPLDALPEPVVPHELAVLERLRAGAVPPVLTFGFHVTDPIPGTLARTVREVWGADGDRWLAALPAALERLAARWRLELGEPYPMTYHWVCRAHLSDGTGDGAPAVVKVGLGDLAAEAAALRGWGGEGAVRLLRRDLAAGALLLGRAEPGTPAADLLPDGDERATAAAVRVLRRLHAAPPPGEVPPLSSRLRALGAHLADPGGDRLVPRPLVEQAVALVRELRVDAPPDVLLHGDLHHDNVLRTGDGWIAIDPHGAVGDPGYDAGAWLYNPPGMPADAAPLAGPGTPRAAGGRARARRRPRRRVGVRQGRALGRVDGRRHRPCRHGTALEVAALLQARLP